MKEFDIGYIDHIGNAEVGVIENNERTPIIDPLRAEEIIDLHSTIQVTHCIVSHDNKKECVTTAPYEGEVVIFPAESQFLSRTDNSNLSSTIESEESKVVSRTDSEGTPVTSLMYEGEVIIFPEDKGTECKDNIERFDKIRDQVARHQDLIIYFTALIKQYTIRSAQSNNKSLREAIDKAEDAARNFKSFVNGDSNLPLQTQEDMLNVLRELTAEVSF